MSYINNIQDLLTPCLKNGNVYVSHSVKNLTAPGDNFGSLMLAVEVKTKPKDSKDDHIGGVLHIVAKKFPEEVAMQDVFQSPLTFRKELEMYRTIIPTLIDFQKEQGVKNIMAFFPNYYNGFLQDAANGIIENGHTKEEKLPNESVILLENLKVSGFNTCKRTIGFDFKTIKAILEDLAAFHAVPVALKRKEPQRFQEKVAPYLDKFYCYDFMDESLKMGDLEAVVSILENNGEYSSLIDRVRAAYTVGSNSGAITVSEPFGTIAHNDLWINNVMVKYENGEPVNKIIDFQVIDYGSPGKDLVFLIFSSVQQEVIEQHYDELIKIYYDKFIATIKELNCDTKGFSLEGLQEELATSARTSQFFHLLIMAQVVFGDENTAKALENNEMPVPTQEQKKRICFIVKDFAQRNWI